MAFIDIYSEVRGAVPDVPLPAARKFAQRAWSDIRRQNLWSFQLYDGPQWITPPLITTGLVTVTQGLNTVTVDATAAAAINAGITSYSPINQRQFRIAANTIYCIADWNLTNTLTLDRIYGEVSQTLIGYQILQNYYSAPYADHLRFLSVRDMGFFLDLFIDKTRAQIDLLDPQRTWYVFPTDVVYYRTNPITQSATYNFHTYELWGVPQTQRNYQLYGIREGPDLVNPTDTIPSVIGEDCVIELAKYYAYQWAEANKGAIPRNQGPDFKFLIGQSFTEHKRLMKDYRRRNREVVNEWLSVRRIGWSGRKIPYYSTLSQTASTGGWYPIALALLGGAHFLSQLLSRSGII